MRELIYFLAGAGGPPGSDGAGGTILPGDPIPGPDVDNTLVFSNLLDWLMFIYNGFIGIARQIFNAMSIEIPFPYFDLSDLSFELVKMPLSIVFLGGGFGLLFIGLMIKWLKGFII